MKLITTSFVFCLTFASCAQKPNISEIQQSVFGNLPIGVKGSEYNRQFQSIAGSSMSHTASTKYPYFRIENRNLLDYRLTFLYPHAFQNKDSIVTKIVFYLYQTKFPSMEVVQSPTTTQEQRNTLTKVAAESQNKLDFLTQEFDTRRNIDSQFLFFLPNAAQGWDFSSLEKEITDNLEKKYGKPSTTNSGGIEYDKYDYSFFKELLWNTDKLLIRLVRKRYPVHRDEPTSEFYMVLIYEFNKEVKQKYGLDKEIDLTQTF